MASHLSSLAFAACDPHLLADFWGGVLQREIDGTTLRPSDETEFVIRFVPTSAARIEPNQMHFDLTSTSSVDQHALVERALALGGDHLDVGQLPEELHVVLQDPEGNEFCVIEPDNTFLRNTATIGALAGDGTEKVGRFWSEALAWPLVWDQDEETAIQAPHGGTKISWGGPPVRQRTSLTRLHLDLAPESDQRSEVDRLVSLGATRTGVQPCESGWVAMADPDGNPFCVSD